MKQLGEDWKSITDDKALVDVDDTHVGVNWSELGMYKASYSDDGLVESFSHALTGHVAKVDKAKQPMDASFELAFNWCETKTKAESGSAKHKVMDIFKKPQGPFSSKVKFLTGKNGQIAWNKLLAQALDRYNKEADMIKKRTFTLDAESFIAPIKISRAAVKEECEERKRSAQEERSKRRRFR